MQTSPLVVRTGLDNWNWTLGQKWSQWDEAKFDAPYLWIHSVLAQESYSKFVDWYMVNKFY
jgi:hypothetical protein